MSKPYMEVDGIKVRVEAEPAQGQELAGVSDDIAARWTDVRTILKHIATDYHGRLVELGTSAPEKALIKFGLKVSAEAGWVIAKATGEANFEVSMTWER